MIGLFEVMFFDPGEGATRGMTAQDPPLPPLPEPMLGECEICGTTVEYSENDVRAYAQAAREPLLKAIAERDAEIELLRQCAGGIATWMIEKERDDLKLKLEAAERALAEAISGIENLNDIACDALQGNQPMQGALNSIAIFSAEYALAAAPK